MKKKFAVMLLALCAVTVFAFGLAACDLIGGDHGGTAHTHNYVLKYDETYHWQECTVSGCTAKTIDRTVHSFDGDICKGCGYKKGEPPVEKDEPSVEGFTYVFDSVKLNCNDESLLDLLKMLEANLSIMLKGTAMTFSAGGKCTSVSGGIVSQGVYEQDGAKLTVTVDSETSEMQVTENGISITKPLDLGEQIPPELENAEITLTVTYVKGTGEITPPTPGEECEHEYNKYEPLNDEQHNVYCEKCEDRKIENHNISGEFGICVCGWHNHIPSEKWETSDYYHWHNCTVSDCHERLDYGMHDRTDGSCVCERNGEVFKFTLNDDGESYCFELVYEKTLTEVIIPAEYSGKPVTSIGRDAFKNCNSLKSVTVPNSVTSIWVLSSCDSLESIYYEGDIADWCVLDGIWGLTENLINKVYIGNEKLSEMTSVTIPDGVTRIASGAFFACRKLESVTIPNSVTVIDNSAFAGCHVLNNVNIPYGVEIIGGNAFGDCFALSDISLPDSLTEIGINAFYQCTALTEITIPHSLKKLGLTAAGNYYSIFMKCKNLKKVIWNSECSAEGTFKSADTPDVSLIIGENVKTIDYNAFFECDGITSVTIPGSVTSIGGSAFSGCSGLTSVTIPDSVTSIKDGAFGGCYKLIEVYNFSDLKIEKGTSDNGSVGYYALSIYTEKDAHSKVEITEDGYSIYNAEDEIYLIGYSGSETNLILPDKINGKNYVINKYAFYNNNSLTGIIIPDSVTSIGVGAFMGCSGLENITVSENNTAYASQDGILYNKEKTEFIHIPKAIKGAITIPDSVTSIGEYAFRDCSGLTSIIIPDGVTSIGGGAFYGCSGLTSVSIGNGVTSIGNSAFYNCSGLTSITIPDSITGIGSGAFYGCNKLIQIENGVEYVDRWVIDFHEANTPVILRNNTVGIGDNAFCYSSRLTSIIIPDSVMYIGAYAFDDCSGLTSITFNGTIEQWKAIEKSDFWNSGTGEYTVFCTDGNLSKSES